MAGRCLVVAFDGSGPDPVVVDRMVATAEDRPVDATRTRSASGPAAAHLAVEPTVEDRADRQPVVVGPQVGVHDDFWFPIVVELRLRRWWG